MAVLGEIMSFVLTLAIVLAVAATEEPAAPSAPAAAPAASPAAKVRAVVHLRDGGTVRGTVKRMRLGKSITLTLASGKSITLDDKDVIEIQIYGRGAPAEAGAGPSSPGAAKGETIAGQPITAPKAASAWPTAATPASGVDTVYLEGGGLLRGTVESEKPDLVIRLVSGRKRTIAAREVKSVVRRGAAEAMDTAFLTDGSVLRGTVESEKPDLVIRLLSGKRRTLPASSVQRLERGRRP